MIVIHVFTCSLNWFLAQMSLSIHIVRGQINRAIIAMIIGIQDVSRVVVLDQGYDSFGGAE